MRRANIAAVAAVALLVGAAVGAGVASVAPPGATDAPADDQGDETGLDDGTNDSTVFDDAEPSVERFEDAAAFRSYLRRGDGERRYHGGRVGPRLDTVNVATATPSAEPAGTPTALETEVVADVAGDDGAGGAGGDDGPRHSGTNVQETGIDEPDVLKTDGEHVYYSRENRRKPVAFDDVPDRDDVAVAGESGRSTGETLVFDASDPAAPEVVENLSVGGRMLLLEDRLVVLQSDRLLGYDVSDPAEPERTWTRPINGSVVTARLDDGRVSLVTRAGIDRADPCPIRPLGPDVAVPCTDVYHPSEPVSTDTTYSAFTVDPASGDVHDSVSFVGSRHGTVVYVSANAVYVTYTERANVADLRLEYLLTEHDDRLSDDVTERLREIRSYDLSAEATRAETEHTLRSWYDSLPEERRETARQRVREGYHDYLADHQRELVRTGIVRVETGDDGGLSVGTVGEVPGTVNDQFSLDEYEGRLRVTTTIPGEGSAESANDLYVLGAENLSTVGSTKGMGLTERVYSVRYVEETAYVVTFRRVDPFHVVDLSDPTDPDVRGELKLPGYSSYLHPVDSNHVMGIGEEDGEVKAVLFDVSDPANPTVADDYRFEAGWSAIADSHHAFLQDPRHGVAFVPTGDGATVLNYTGGELTVQRHVDTDGGARRAMYLGDYLYVFGDESLTVLDERDWSVTTTRTFGKTG